MLQIRLSGWGGSWTHFGIGELAGLPGLWPSQRVLIESSHDVESRSLIRILNSNGSRSKETSSVVVRLELNGLSMGLELGW
ncbi:hypothetical protein C2S51_022378 [Perilla frutescens var. frutescens]|nr:hypothetical protein C2S51_022378 [Perilla frutescens var. frutescens]